MKDMYMDAVNGKFTEFETKMKNVISEKFENHERIVQFKQTVDKYNDLKEKFSEISAE